MTKAVSIEPDNFEANNNLGKAHLQDGNFPEAITYFQKALKLDSKNNEVRVNLASAYANSQDYESAKAMYSEVVKADNKNWDAYVELAKVCIALGQNSEAEKWLVYLQETNPSYKSAEVSTLLSGI